MTALRPTPLQLWLAAAFDVLDDARAELDDNAYSSFVAILTDRIGYEAAKLAVGEGIRIARDAAQEAAA